MRRAREPGAGEGQMEGGVMFGHKGAGDVRGLEEVFRSEEFGRGTGNAVGDVAAPLMGPEDVLFAQEFGRPRSVVRLHDPSDVTDPTLTPSGDALGAAWTGDTGESEPRPQADPSDDGAPVGDADAETEPASGNRRSTRYWTLACVCALAALLAAGVSAGSGSSHRPSIAAQGAHGAARQGREYHTTGPATTGPTAPAGNGGGASGSGPFARGRGISGNGQLEQCARRSRVVVRRGDLHRCSGFACGFVRRLCRPGWRCRWRWFTVAGRRQQPCRSHRSPHIHGREHGECSRIVGDDGREPSGRIHTGRRFDDGSGEQRRHRSRPGGRRVVPLTTAHCRPVADRLQQQRATQTVSAAPLFGRNAHANDACDNGLTTTCDDACLMHNVRRKSAIFKAKTSVQN